MCAGALLLFAGLGVHPAVRVARRVGQGGAGPAWPPCSWQTLAPVRKDDRAALRLAPWQPPSWLLFPALPAASGSISAARLNETAFGPFDLPEPGKWPRGAGLCCFHLFLPTAQPPPRPQVPSRPLCSWGRGQRLSAPSGRAGGGPSRVLRPQDVRATGPRVAPRLPGAEIRRSRAPVCVDLAAVELASSRVISQRALVFNYRYVITEFLVH